MTARLLIVASLIFFSACPALAQKRHKPASRRHTASKRKASRAKAKPTAKPPIIGAQVTIVTKTGERVTGPVNDITAQSIKIGGDVETVVPFESVASMSFNEGSNQTADLNSDSASGEGPRQNHAISTRDVQSLFAAFQTMESLVKSGPDYTDYSRQLTELRRAVDKFVGKYSTSDDPIEIRITALAAGAVDDYTWARTIWTLRLGRPADATVSASDSPAVADALQLYPDLAPPAGSGAAADKLIAGLAHHASEKIDAARKLLPPPEK